MRKRGQYGHYTPEDRLKIGKYGSLHDAATVNHFTQVLGQKINDSTVCGMVKDYKKKLAEALAEEEIQELPPSKRGRPLFLDHVLDDQVCNHLKALGEAGSVVNHTTVIVTAKSIVGHLTPGDLAEHGGHVNLTKA